MYQVLNCMNCLNQAIEICRRSIISTVSKKPVSIIEESSLDPKFLKKYGVFTTLYTKIKDNSQLRGCIGIPYPTEKLHFAISESAKKAASKDPRFPPVTKQELPLISFEIEILSQPLKVEFQYKEELLNKIELGRHGLMVRYKNTGGLLLPNVPLKYNWSKEQFLDAIFRKSFLDQNNLLDTNLQIHTFEAQIIPGHI
jgi:uncharacterized protein